MVTLTSIHGLLAALLPLACICGAQTYSAAAGIRPAHRHRGASILPGGRVIAPVGIQHPTGAGTFGLAVSSSGRYVVAVNTSAGRNSVTIVERAENRAEVRHVVPSQEPGSEEEWRGVFMGIAFVGDRGFYVSEGNSGRISYFEVGGHRRRFVDLNGGDYRDSYSGDLALDADRNILYAVDQANSRVAAIDIRTRQVVRSIPVGRLPFALALSPDRIRLYVTQVGVFEYRRIPESSGLSFPAFGFPNPNATAKEASSLCVVDVREPAAAQVARFIRTGPAVGNGVEGGSSPSGVLAAGGKVFVSNAATDSITVVDAASETVEGEIALRIPGLDSLRGVLPAGMAYDAKRERLLVAEAGINAVAVVDPRSRMVLGRLPTAWFPSRVAVRGDSVFVAAARGHGLGPNVRSRLSELRNGALMIFQMPDDTALAAHTAVVMEANGFLPRPAPERPLPSAIRHVVLIVKSGRSYDEVLGDVENAAGSPELARLGSRGFAEGRGQRFNLRHVNVTPNHHAIARRWAMGDNFYADSDVAGGGRRWLAGSYPNLWTESSLMASGSDQRKDFRLTAPGRLSFPGGASSAHPEDLPAAGTIWHHFARHGISFYNFGEGFDLAGVEQGRGLEPTGARFRTNVPMPEPLFVHTSRQYPGFNLNIPDQYRADRFIREVRDRHLSGGAEFPRFVYILLPNDAMGGARPEDGYPYEESFVADNDYALGRIVEFLSATKWWREMAVFITEDGTPGGADHVDAQRTVVMAAGPWIKRGHVSHVNTSFPGLLKTIFRVLRLPPLNLYDAVSSDLSDVFTDEPDFTPFKALPVDARLFDPSAAKGVAIDGNQ